MDKTTNKKPAISTQSLVTMAIFAAILSVSAYASIPIPLPSNPHITLLNFVILLVALLFPLEQSFLVILVWMLLGILGVPVFIAGGSGFGYIIGPYGGYTATFLVVAVVLPLIRGKKYKRIRYTAAAIVGVLIIDILGMLWLMLQNHLSLSAAFLAGFVPFIPLDLVKAVIAAQIIPPLRRIVKAE